MRKNEKLPLWLTCCWVPSSIWFISDLVEPSLIPLDSPIWNRWLPSISTRLHWKTMKLQSFQKIWFSYQSKHFVSLKIGKPNYLFFLPLNPLYLEGVPFLLILCNIQIYILYAGDLGTGIPTPTKSHLHLSRVSLVLPTTIWPNPLKSEIIHSLHLIFMETTNGLGSSFDCFSIQYNCLDVFERRLFGQFFPPPCLLLRKMEHSRGEIQLIFGPMFSGKSTELLRRIRRYTVAQRKCLVLKYQNDTRYDAGEKVSTHDLYVPSPSSKINIRIMWSAYPCALLEDVEKQVQEDAYDVIGVDEGQFVHLFGWISFS